MTPLVPHNSKNNQNFRAIRISTKIVLQANFIARQNRKTKGNTRYPCKLISINKFTTVYNSKYRYFPN